MKNRLAFLLAGVLVCAFASVLSPEMCSAQTKGATKGNGGVLAPGGNESAPYERLNFRSGFRPVQFKPFVVNNQPRLIPIFLEEENTVLLLSSKEDYAYLGDFTFKKGSNKFLRSGRGIDYDGNEMFLGGWKRDLRHGKGYLMGREGGLYVAEWKYGEMVEDSKHLADAQEIEAFEKERDRLYKGLNQIEVFL